MVTPPTQWVQNKPTSPPNLLHLQPPGSQCHGALLVVQAHPAASAPCTPPRVAVSPVSCTRHSSPASTTTSWANRSSGFWLSRLGLLPPCCHPVFSFLLCSQCSLKEVSHMPHPRRHPVPPPSTSAVPSHSRLFLLASDPWAHSCLGAWAFPLLGEEGLPSDRTTVPWYPSCQTGPHPTRSISLLSSHLVIIRSLPPDESSSSQGFFCICLLPCPQHLRQH